VNLNAIKENDMASVYERVLVLENSKICPEIHIVNGVGG
jgi:hypothetical protein